MVAYAGEGQRRAIDVDVDDRICVGDGVGLEETLEVQLGDAWDVGVTGVVCWCALGLWSVMMSFTFFIAVLVG